MIVAPRGLAVGSYTGWVRLSAPGLDDIVIPVILVVSGLQIGTVSPPSLLFSSTIGGAAPASQVVTIANPASFTLSFHATGTFLQLR